MNIVSDKDRRDVNISITITKEENRILEEKASQMGMTKSSYIRWMLFKGK